MTNQTEKGRPSRKRKNKDSELKREEIRALQTVLRNGEYITILGVGNNSGRYSSLFDKISSELRKRHHPLRVIMGKGAYSRQEIIRYLRESTKVIAIQLSNESGPPATGTNYEKMTFPDVLQWSALLGIPPEVVLKGGKLTELSSLEKLLEEIGLEKE